MVKDIKYIIKRIIIGVGIALALMFIRGYLLIGVNAKEILTADWGTHQFQPNYSSTYTFFNTNNLFSGKRYGYLYFNFSIYSSTQASPIITTIFVNSDTNNKYVCHLGSVSNSNSGSNSADLQVSTTYSAVCPVDFGEPGLTTVTVQYLYYPSNNNSFTITFGDNVTFESISESDFNSAISNQITNDNTNTTNIINNQNQNTQQQIESQKVCTDFSINKSSIIEDGYLASSNGSIGSGSSSGVTDYISITNSTDIIVHVPYSNSNSLAYCFYNSSKSFISCGFTMSLSTGDSLNIPSNASFVRFTINKNTNIPQYVIRTCKNGNQAISDSQQQINDSITSTDGVSDNDISDLFSDFETSDTPISDLLTMPITLLQAFISGFGGTCRDISLGRLYGNNLIIPCVNLESKLGSDLWSLIDILLSLFMIYNIGQLMITAFDSLTSLKDNFDWLYGVEGGKHAGPGNTRVERNSDLY